VLQDARPDILCLQEVHAFGLKKLQDALSYEHSLKWGGCAILSNLCMEEVEIPERRARKGYHPRFLTAKISVPGQDIFVTCCHLNHKDELKRMSEVRKMKEQLDHLFKVNEAQVWTGDFNSLTREDYSEVAWKEITEVRRNNHWELPKTQVTSFIGGLGFVDCWGEVGKPEPVSTCRFLTHIDYVFVNKEVLKSWDCTEVQTWKLWRILGTGFPVGFWLGSRFLVMIPVLVANYIVIGKKPTA